MTQGAGSMRGKITTITLGPVGGGTRRLPVTVDAGGRPIPVALQSDEGFPQPLVFGESAKRSDSRTAQIIFDDWTGGGGEDEYNETEGLGTFGDATLDTRYQKSLVLPPLGSKLGGTLSSTVYGQRGLSLNYADAKHITWHQGYAAVYKSSVNQWISLATLGGPSFCRDVIQANGYTWARGSVNLYRTTDGLTWSMAFNRPIRQQALYHLPPRADGQRL